MKVTCICGKSEMDFKSLCQADFPNGWEQPCCVDIPPTIDPHESSKNLIDQWIRANALLTGSRNGLWVSASKCYEHFKSWLVGRGLADHVPTVTRFGRDMGKLCSSKRKNSGIVYLLERDIV